jgi:hypothetical protein
MFIITLYGILEVNVMANRNKVNTILIGIIVLGLVNLTFDLGIKSMKYNTHSTPFLFGCITSFFCCAIFIYYISKIPTVSINQETSSMKNAAILINNNRVVIDMNETMLETFKFKKEELKGNSISDMSHEIFVAVDIILDGITRSDSIDIDIDNSRKHYKIDTSVVNDKKSRKIGHLITLVDVTDLGIETA